MHRISLFLFFLLVTLCACQAPRDQVYWQDLTGLQQSLTRQEAPVLLQPGDKLNIVVSSNATPDLAASYNKLLLGSRIGNGSLEVATSVQPYLLDASGKVVLPALGAVQLGGHTLTQAASLIGHLLREGGWLRDAHVEIEVLNHYVSLLGEVQRPGRVDFERETLSLSEALTQAGDLTIKADRRRLIVLREDSSRVQAHPIDLTQSHSSLTTQAFQLRPGDVIYATPSKHRQREARAYGNVWHQPYIYLSLVSLLTSVAAFLLAL